MIIKHHAENQFQDDFLSMLEGLCLEWEFWPISQTINCLSDPEYHLYTLTDRTHDSSKFCGALLSYHGPFSVDVIYLYINSKYRGMGLAQRLLATLWATLNKEATMETLFLEVRKTNSSAIRTYRKFGMKQIGQRKNYYQDGEDALVFSREKKK